MELIFPNEIEEICLVVKSKEDKENFFGERLDKNSSLYRNIMEQLDFDFHKLLIKLNQCSRNLSKNLEGPNILYISDNVGGFPRTGILLKEKNEYVEYKNLNFVDLVLNDETLRNGELGIFSHELAHVMMENIIPNMENYSKASKPHGSVGITDYFMAFIEGWGEHFERLVYENIDFYKDIYKKSFYYDKQILKLWNCNIDSEMRINGIYKNKYIYKKLLPQIDISNVDIEDVIIAHHTSDIYDRTKLLNPQEMMSSEGVIATLFYRINTNEILQNNYLKKDIISSFCIRDIPKDVQIENLFTPFENVILKNFWVWNSIKDNLNENSIPFIEYIKEWCKCFPEDKDEIINIFITTTLGETVDKELGKIYEKLSYEGMIGNMDDFIHILGEYRDKLNNLCKKVKNNEVAIDNLIGPELWIENKDVSLPKFLWSKDSKVNLMVNINTASVYEIMSLTNISYEQAEKILKLRNEKKYFSSLEDVNEIIKKIVLYEDKKKL